jgi:hypothetical protein
MLMFVFFFWHICQTRLPTVIYARDKWLKWGGRGSNISFPCCGIYSSYLLTANFCFMYMMKYKIVTFFYFWSLIVQIYMALITNSERYHGTIDFWCDVYGIVSCKLFDTLSAGLNYLLVTYFGMSQIMFLVLD